MELLPCDNASNSETIDLAKRIMFLINEYEKTGDATALVTKMFPLTADHPRKDSTNPNPLKMDYYLKNWNSGQSELKTTFNFEESFWIFARKWAPYLGKNK